MQNGSSLPDPCDLDVQQGFRRWPPRADFATRPTIATVSAPGAIPQTDDEAALVALQNVSVFELPFWNRTRGDG